MNRKRFLQLGSFGLGSLPFLSFASGVTKPLVISTWDSGKAVNAAAWKILSASGKAIDAVEAGANFIENQINCCVGLGGYPDRDGIVTLDACIMDEQANCGAVAGLERIKHPVSVARKLMELTPHVLLVGAGAQKFAVENGFALESTTLSDDARKAYDAWLLSGEYKPIINIENEPAIKKSTKQNGPFAPAFFPDGSPNHDTMGLVAIDQNGDLSGAVTTSGMAFKMHGRAGDSPILGAGLFVDNEVGAATSSGVGEEVIRICGTHLVVELMRQGYSPEKACKKAVERIVKRDRTNAKNIQVGFLALNKKGAYGGYAIQKGFMFSVKSGAEDSIHASKYLL
ncbi:MAG: N(4)-(beta-N-acetylglucosaminyl)-L-asparaginase [Gloeobacteraceae cyanobacterium ES-bin-316]|nr:N(4)-(beta-N-acetylglucosaminyl)-L-asparaginase [Ferruginibacter sp.]